MSDIDDYFKARRWAFNDFAEQITDAATDLFYTSDYRVSLLMNREKARQWVRGILDAEVFPSAYQLAVKDTVKIELRLSLEGFIKEVFGVVVLEFTMVLGGLLELTRGEYLAPSPENISIKLRQSKLDNYFLPDRVADRFGKSKIRPPEIVPVQTARMRLIDLE